ncbi:DUF6427 family protein [Lacinutrix sp. 5H-3-7-4]|uniref:DUF6427 family protein n=1 Tax=Lacinutrix sp. (strain 5H-3-7-4) TaxID=983544 RepID=UPI00020A38B9|nr:DUF6427 family protein [Lacinutrix sp. 5H-3-7-4]AEH00902.1 hypothetical protein Lacal_1054 [Lacinutrix sp. 5H-3-7-4]
MITSIFSKSKPINFLIVFLVSLLAIFIAINKYAALEVVSNNYTVLATTLVCLFLTALVIDFIVTKNTLSQKQNLETIVFCLLLFAVPQVFLNYKIVIANLLFLLALRRLLSLRTQKDVEKKLFDASVLIALASIFHFWCILFLPLIYITMLFYTITDIKKWAIPLLGVFSVVIVAITYSLLVNNNFFSALYINPAVSINLNAYNSIQFIVVITMLLSLGLWSSVFFLNTIKKKKKTFRPSYKVVFVSCLIALLIAIITPIKTGNEFLFLFAPLSIVISNYIEIIEEKWFKEMFFIILVVVPIILLL